MSSNIWIDAGIVLEAIAAFEVSRQERIQTKREEMIKKKMDEKPWLIFRIFGKKQLTRKQAIAVLEAQDRSDDFWGFTLSNLNGMWYEDRNELRKIEALCQISIQKGNGQIFLDGSAARIIAKDLAKYVDFDEKLK